MSVGTHKAVLYGNFTVERVYWRPTFGLIWGQCHNESYTRRYTLLRGEAVFHDGAGGVKRLEIAARVKKLRGNCQVMWGVQQKGQDMILS